MRKLSNTAIKRIIAGSLALALTFTSVGLNNFTWADEKSGGDNSTAKLLINYVIYTIWYYHHSIITNIFYYFPITLIFCIPN